MPGRGALDRAIRHSQRRGRRVRYDRYDNAMVETPSHPAQRVLARTAFPGQGLGLLSMAKVVFVCWGNICRSPMAERVARGMAAERGLDVEVDSVGISAEESGNPIDRRAAAVLRDAGYSTDGHRARRVTVEDLASADLVVAAEQFHIGRLQQLCPDATYALLNDFNPAMPKGKDLDDPWYGSASGFRSTLADVEAAMPGILDALA